MMKMKMDRGVEEEEAIERGAEMGWKEKTRTMRERRELWRLNEMGLMLDDYYFLLSLKTLATRVVPGQWK